MELFMNAKFWYLIIMIFCTPIFCNCAGLLLPWSAEAAALNNSGLLSQNVSGCNINPALGNNGYEMTVSQYYGLNELMHYQTAAGFKFKKIFSAIAVSSFSHRDYKEFNSILNAGYEYNMLRFGINYRFYHLHITKKGSRKISACDLGVIWKKDNFISSISWLNIHNRKEEVLNLSEYLIWETVYSFDEQIKLGFKLEKEKGLDFQPSIASSILIHPILNIFASYSENPETTGMGFSVKIRNWNIAYGIQYHPVLNMSHFITIYYAKTNSNISDL